MADPVRIPHRQREERRNREGSITRKIWKWSLAALLSFAVIFGLGAADTDAASPYKIEVNKSTNKLTLYKNGRVYKQYPVATGRTPSLTPEGTFPIVVKFVKPGWKGIPGGHPNNPLGERWLGPHSLVPGSSGEVMVDPPVAGPPVSFKPLHKDPRKVLVNSWL